MNEIIGNIVVDDTTTVTSTVFELSLDASSDIAGMTTAIQSLNTAVEEVRVDIYNSFTSRWEENGVPELFSALGDVPHLLKIEFYGLRIFPYKMPISMAQRTLCRAVRLEEFCLVGVSLSAPSADDFRRPDVEDDFAEFSETLRQHPSLKTFGLDNCRLRDELTGPTLDEAIVSVLVQIPTLEKVIIRAMEVSMWGKMTCASVGRLCSSSTLKSLELFVFSESNCSNSGSSFMVTMADSLIETKDTSRLEELSISGCLGGMHGAKAISEMLLINKKLRSLEMHLRDRSDDDEVGIIELSKALGKNKTLTKFQLHGSTDRSGSWDARKAFLNMLQNNYTLLDSVLVFHPGFLRPDNELYLKLNQVGRGRLLENINLGKQEWIETLVKVRNDIDCLFYFLIINPSLCSSSLLLGTPPPPPAATAATRTTRTQPTTTNGGHQNNQNRKRKRASSAPMVGASLTAPA